MGLRAMGFDRNAADDQAFGHKPVLLDECLDALDIKPEGIYLDGTLGRAGHSLEIAKRLTTGRLICLDRDETAIEAAKIRLADYKDRVTLVHSNFSRIADVLREMDIDGVDGMLFDLGVSSPQLDEADRGFSYMHDAPLDMRMDRTAALTARDVVNDWSYEDLRRILFAYGEERYAPAIARAIVSRRQESPIETTGQLEERHVALLTQYEKTFDLATVKRVAEEAGMTKPTAGQVEYLELPAADSTVVYRSDAGTALENIAESISRALGSVVEYFR